MDAHYFIIFNNCFSCISASSIYILVLKDCFCRTSAKLRYDFLFAGSLSVVAKLLKSCKTDIDCTLERDYYLKVVKGKADGGI